MANEDVLKLQHSYKCTPEKLFDAWLDPALVAQFMCPGAMHVSHLEWQAKVGGLPIHGTFVRRIRDGAATTGLLVHDSDISIDDVTLSQIFCRKVVG